MSPNFRRYLPFVLIAFFLLLVLPSLFKKKSTTTTASPATQSAQTIRALDLVDRTELLYDSTHGRYTPDVADLLVANHVLAQDITSGFTIQLSVGADGNSYSALVQSPVLSLLRARDNRSLAVESCVVVKSATGVACPPTGKTTVKATTK